MRRIRNFTVDLVSRAPARVQTKLLVAFLAMVVLLIGLGAWMLLTLTRRVGPPAVARPAASMFLPTFGLTIVNPLTLVVFAGIVPQLPVAGSLANAAALALALSAGSLFVQSAIAAAGAGISAALPGEGWRRAVTAAAAAGILAFGIYGLGVAI